MSSPLTANDVIRVGNIGSVVNIQMQIRNSLEVLINLDLTLATSVQVEFLTPQGTSIVVNGNVLSPGSSGLIQYADVTGAVFNSSTAVSGRWQVRGIVNFPGGALYKGSWSAVPVED